MAYLITFTTYGTHLPGDARGSFDHVRNGERRFLVPNSRFETWNREHSNQQPFFLDDAVARAAVRDAIVEVCSFRSWSLHALHVRPTHVHGVVESGCEPGAVFRDWKAYSTRRLRRMGLVLKDRIVWTHHGNVTFLTSDEELRAAFAYVLDHQGERLEWSAGQPPR